MLENAKQYVIRYYRNYKEEFNGTLDTYERETIAMWDDYAKKGRTMRAPVNGETVVLAGPKAVEYLLESRKSKGKHYQMWCTADLDSELKPAAQIIPVEVYAWLYGKPAATEYRRKLYKKSADVSERAKQRKNWDHYSHKCGGSKFF